MAVDAHHLKNNNILPQQQRIVTERDMLMSAMEDNINMMMYNNQNNNNQHIAAAYGGLFPISGTTTVESSLLPVFASSPAVMPVTKNQASVKDDSGLTYAIPSMMQRKRGRDHSGLTINQQSFAPAATYQKVESFSHSRSQNLNNQFNGVGSYSFLGEDVSVQILQQQLDIDRFIYQHMEKVRMEIDERRKRNSRRMIEVVEEGILKRLKAKEDEIEKIGRLNWALEERVRSLTVENQIWRELAQTNEATANALRSNLEQVLAQITDVREPEGTAAAVPINNLDDDAESCCGSSSPDQYFNRRGEEDEEGWRTVPRAAAVAAGSKCRRCGNGEACVVMLTCRHMCLCAGCGSARTPTITCPVCKTVNEATLLVNLS